MNKLESSTVSTKYMYQRISDILNMEEMDDVAFSLFRLLDELANHYKLDTGKAIGEKK